MENQQQSFFWEKVCAVLFSLLITLTSGFATYYAKSTKDSIDKEIIKVDELQVEYFSLDKLISNHELRLNQDDIKISSNESNLKIQTQRINDLDGYDYYHKKKHSLLNFKYFKYNNLADNLPKNPKPHETPQAAILSKEFLN